MLDVVVIGEAPALTSRGAPLGADGSGVVCGGNEQRSASRRKPTRWAGGGPHHLARSARIDERRESGAENSCCPGWGARHNRPLGKLGPHACVWRVVRAWCAHQANSVCDCAHFAQCAVMLNRRSRFTPARLRDGRAQRADIAVAGVADEAVGSFIADGASGGQHAPTPGHRISRWCRDSGRRSDKASARPFALWRGGTRDEVAACKPQAGERVYAGQRSGAAAAGQQVRR